MTVWGGSLEGSASLGLKDGKEVWRLMGPEDWTGKKAAALVNEAG